jgi:hypothetical protein
LIIDTYIAVGVSSVLVDEADGVVVGWRVEFVLRFQIDTTGVLQVPAHVAFHLHHLGNPVNLTCPAARLCNNNNNN